MLPFYFLKTLERRPGLIRGRQNCLVGEYDLMIPELPQNAVKFIFRQPSEDHHGCGKRGSREGSCGANCLKAGQSRQGAQRLVVFGRTWNGRRACPIAVFIELSSNWKIRMISFMRVSFLPLFPAVS